MINQLITLLICSLACSFTIQATEISGSIDLSEDWEPKIFLSHIHSFDDLNTASFHFLISESTIDENGIFLFDSLSLPKGDHLYRLHICKQGDPVSTIIIGGQEQNHLHFIANENSNLKINIETFYSYSITGHSGNNALRRLFDLKKELSAPLEIPSEQNRKLHRGVVLEQFISIANESKSIINQLLAAHLIHESFGLADHIDLFEQMNLNLADLGDTSPYYTEFQSLVEFARFNNNSESNASTRATFLPWLGLALLLAISGFYMLMRQRRNKTSSVHQLSIQEKKVYELLKQGKSNKEISSALHIEVSTVKSHVYKIYTKLGIKSRKELVQ